MTTIRIKPPKLHQGQHKVRKNDARFRVLACGRRWGKTRLGSALCVESAILGGRSWWVAPSYKMANVGWRLIKALSYPIPGVEIRQGDRLVTFPTGGELGVRSADNPDSLRGEGLDFVVLDECAFMNEAAWVEALRPALSDRNGRAMFISTPSGRNWFFRLFQHGIESNDTYASWQLPTSDNPYIADSEIEAARETLPEDIFKQEYMARFLENEGAVFRNIGANLNAPPTLPKDHKGHHIIGGVDWGKHQDYTVFSIGCVDCGQEVELYRSNKVDYHVQREMLEMYHQRWGVASWLAESNAMGEPVIEQLHRAGLPIQPFQTTATSKPPLIENLKLSLERVEFQFLNIPIATAELEAYEQKISKTTGRTSYSAPEGLHDDTVMARALMRKMAGSGLSVLW